MARPPRLERPSAPRRALAGAAAGLLVALIGLGARRLDVVDGIERNLIDLRTRHAAGTRPPDPRIVISEVREEDVAAVQRAFGQTWPWALDVNAYAMRFLAAAGAAGVVIDVYHLDRGAGPDDVPDPDALSDADRDARGIQASEADAYAAALRELGHVVLAFELSDAPDWDLPVRRDPAAARLGAQDVGTPPEGLVRAGANLPVRRVIEAATYLGFANTRPDPDGVIRRFPTAGRWDGRPVLPLAVQGARVLEGPLQFVPGAVLVGSSRQRLMPDGAFLIPFQGPAGRTYPRLEPARLLGWAAEALDGAGEVPPEARAALEGRLVVWGVSLTGLLDVHPTAMDPATHGPEIVASAIDALLHGDGRVRAPAGADAALVLVLALGLGVLGGVVRRTWVAHLAAALAAILVVALAFALFARGTVLDLFTPLAVVAMAWGATAVLRYALEGRRSRWLEGAFSRYLAPPVIEALKQDPGLLALGGRRRDITILFSDVAGFTKISEGLEPEQVVALLNRYLTMHANAVMEHEGVVDKFEGDAVMAFFGDPVPQPDHAERACRSALAVEARLPRLEPVWRAMGLSAFGVRIGLNSGPAVVGNMGSEERLAYTCMGDAVNLASRLEGANKAFGSRILLGEATWRAVQDRMVLRPLGAVKVVGRGAPVEVAELLGTREDAPEATFRHAEAFARALAAARADDLDAAREAAESARALRPDDGPVAWLRRLLEDLEAGRVPRPWSGVTVLESK